MIVGVKEITSIINKVSDLTAGDKIIPGLLLKVYKNEASEGKLSVCYSDGHKSFIEEIGVLLDETDHIGDVVVSFEQMKRAISNCQPSGIINTDGGIVISYLDNNIIRVSADQYMKIYDNDGNETGNRKIAVKKMDLSWTEPNADMKSSILSRMKYESIFEPDAGTDEYDRAELIEALNKTSVEKGKNIYISANVQSVFVANQAHVTSVPLSQFELTMEEFDEIRAELSEKGSYTEEQFNNLCKERCCRVRQSIVMTQPIAKAIIGILGKCSSEKILVHRKDKCCNIIAENDTEKVGIWFEMAQASKAHIGALERYNSLGYKSYQLLFLREFLANNIKSALESSKSDKIALKFEDTELETPTCAKDLVITSGNAGASIADTYRVNPDDLIDPTNDIGTRTFNISLKVISDMMAQLKTSYIAMDINVDETGTICIRLAEVDAEKMTNEYANARKQTEILCNQQGLVFDPMSTPTPIEIKLGYRINTLNTKQFTILSK